VLRFGRSDFAADHAGEYEQDVWYKQGADVQGAGADVLSC
jgi:hypothetical protein